MGGQVVSEYILLDCWVSKYDYPEISDSFAGLMWIECMTFQCTGLRVRFLREDICDAE